MSVECAKSAGIDGCERQLIILLLNNIDDYRNFVIKGTCFTSVRSS